MSDEFIINAGSDVLGVDPASTSAEIGIDQIAALVADPDAPLAEISRLIALEIVKLLQMMSKDRKDPALRAVNVTQKDLNDRLKAYRVLQRTLTESNQLSKKDVLNLDGDKFHYVLGELIKWFRSAITDAGIEENDAHNIMLQFSDKVKQGDAALRIYLNKIGTGR